MKLITRTELARDAAALWKSQYYSPRDKKWGSTIDGSALTTYRKMCAAKGSADGIEIAVNGKSWTQSWCSVCKDYKPMAIEFGDGQDSRIICCECINQSRTLIP